MKIVKRNGKEETLSFDKILVRLRKLCSDKGLAPIENIDTDIVAQKVIEQMYDGITSSDIDNLAANISISMSIDNPFYADLASRITVSNLQKNTPNTFHKATEVLFKAGIVNETYYKSCVKFRKEIQQAIDHQRDYDFDYFGIKTLERSYLLKKDKVTVERPQYMYMRVAVALYPDDVDMIKTCYDGLSKKLFTHASPTLFNAGTMRQQCSSCYILSTEDSIGGIFKTVSDCAYISKHAGGIGLSISNIRAKGSKIRSTNGHSDGIVPMLQVYNQTARYVNQSSRRNGSFAVYLEPHHADIFDFLDMKKNNGDVNLRARDLFYALWVPDLFMEKVEKDEDWYLMCPDESKGLDDVYGEDYNKLYNEYIQKKLYTKKIKARDLWNNILSSQIETGTPYMCYKDHVNRKSNQKHLGVIKSSNLCVAPETMILTSKGYYPIKQLENEQVEVWNGKEFSQTIVRKTGENQNLLKVRLSTGVLECTPYHKFYIVTGKRPNEYPVLKQIEAKDLQPGMRLIKTEFPIIEKGEVDFPYPYEHGLFTADGTYEHNSKNSHLPRLTLYKDKKDLLPYIKTRLPVCEEDSNNRIHCRLPITIKPKYTVPINYELNIKLRWLEGLVDGDGTLIKSDKLTGIQITSIHYDFLTDVMYMLNTLGCNPKIRKNQEDRFKFLPDGKGGSKLYHCKSTYRLLLTSYDVYKLSTIGFSPKRLKISSICPKNNTKRWLVVENIEHTGRISDTYCFKEEKRGMGVFNGILTGQCAEISLYNTPNSTAVCNIATISLPKFIEDIEGKKVYNYEKLGEVVRMMVKNLNKVIDINYYPTPETEHNNKEHRPIALGVQGFYNLLMELRLPFDSSEARDINKKIFEHIQYNAILESSSLAEKEGSYNTYEGSPISKGIFQHNMWGVDEKTLYMDWDSLRQKIKKHGVRNSLLTALPPTASTSQILGNVESFEVLTSNIYMRNVLSGTYPVLNRYLINDLMSLNLWNKKLSDKIVSDEGSIQNIDEIPQKLKNLYKTTWEVSQKVTIELSADRAPFIDHSQSLNIFMKAPTVAKLSSMHFYGWKRGLKTGMYYLRTLGASSAEKFSVSQEKQNEELVCSLDNKEDCVMCSG